MLIAHGADPNLDDGSWLPYGMVQNRVIGFVLGKVIKLVLRFKRRPNALITHFGNSLKSTPLHCAAITGNLRSLEVLLRAGADVEGCAPCQRSMREP